MKTMKKRCLALLLSAVMLLSVVLPVSVPVLSVTAQPYIALDGEKISSLVIREDEKVYLEAVSPPMARWATAGRSGILRTATAGWISPACTVRLFRCPMRSSAVCWIRMERLFFVAA